MRSGAAALLAVALTLAAQSEAGASVFVGHSGWFWSDPLPQGNTLRAIAFSGARGYAAGDFGTVIRSDDGGTSWSGLTTGITAPLRLLQIIDPDTVVVASRCELRRSDDAGRSFQSLRWSPALGSCRVPISSIAFPSSQVGYLVLADGTVMRTRDGGATWAPRTRLPGTRASGTRPPVKPTGSAFPKTDTGFVTTSGGSIYRTTDGGTSWSPVASAAEGLTSIAFPDLRTGFAVGGSSLMSSTDGGQTWTRSTAVDPAEHLAGISCASSQVCVATSSAGDELFTTQNAGQSWTAIAPASQSLFAAAYSTPQHLIAAGLRGTMVESTDGGQNFTTISSELGGSFTLVRSDSPSAGYAAGKVGSLALTVDGGVDWRPLTPPVSTQITDVSFPNAATGFLLARDNVLMRTDDGGATWQLLDPGTFVTVRAVLATDARNLVLVMQRGLRRSSDGGLSFSRVRQRSVATATLTGGGRARKALYAYGPRNVVVSVDGGRNWRPGSVPGTRGERLRRVDMVSAAVGYALTRDGRVWRTLDGARHWGELTGIGTEIGTDVAFGDARAGYLAIPQFGSDSAGYVLRTTDGGVTWRPQLVDASAIAPGALAASGANTAFAIAGTHLLATNRGGDIGQRSTLSLTVQRLRPGKPGVIAITGTLKPASGGETVVVSERQGRSHRWLYEDVTVAASGRFSVFTHVTQTTRFVAQWSGDDKRIGAGTPALTVGIGRRFGRARVLTVHS